VFDKNMLFYFVLSFSAAVNALTDAWDLPSIARSSLFFFYLLTFTISCIYYPGSGPSFGSSHDL
jgi:hypothetical protein